MIQNGDIKDKFILKPDKIYGKKNEGLLDFLKKKKETVSPIYKNNDKIIDLLENTIPTLLDSDITKDYQTTTTGNIVPTLYTYSSYEFDSKYGQIKSTYNTTSGRGIKKEDKELYRIFINNEEVQSPSYLSYKMYNDLKEKFNK